MKKMLFLLLGAAAVSAFGETTPTEAVLGGEIGVTKIVSKLSNTVVAVSYNDLDPTVTSGIAISNLVKTANLTPGDQLAIFSNGVYTTWTLNQNGTEGPKYWEKNEKAFTVGADDKLTVESGAAASDVTAAVGTGIWLIRQNPTQNGDAIPFYIYGKPSTAITIKTKPGVWNLVGNPTQDNVLITPTVAQGANNDEIRVPGERGLVNYLYKATSNAWLRAKDVTGKWGPAPTIAPGTGFWIKTGGEITINWQSAGN